jgi:hypothetical protein
MLVPVCAVDATAQSDGAVTACLGLADAVTAALIGPAIDKQPAAPSKSLLIAGVSLVPFECIYRPFLVLPIPE